MNSARITSFKTMVEILVAILPILEFPDPRLRKKARIIDTVDQTIQQLVDDMTETMYQAKGIGLAATQVNQHLRLIIIDLSEEQNEALCLINPELLEQQGLEESEEGCLSVPSFFENIKRAKKITVKALNREGEPYELKAEGLLAICIQHEMDHLEGKLFVDYLSSFKRQRIKTKLAKVKRKKHK
jgi:peptide deformylase